MLNKCSLGSYSRMVLILFLGLILIGGCKGVDKREHFTDAKWLDLYSALQTAWPKYVANSLSGHGAYDLAQRDEACRELFDCFRQHGYEPRWVFRLTDWFLLELRDLRRGGMKYIKFKKSPEDGGIVGKPFDLKENDWLCVDVSCASLRFAPIVADTIVGFTEMWDSLTDTIVSVPDGFHGLIQGGAGMFLLRNDEDERFYLWDAVSRTEPKRWKYYFPFGCHVRSSYFVAMSEEKVKTYAFAVGLEPIPNSEGATAISACGAYKGRQYYQMTKLTLDGWKFYYYAWPEKGREEPLSNGTETFGGRQVVFRDGKLVVLSERGWIDVEEYLRK